MSYNIVKKQKFEENFKILQGGGVRDSTERPTIRRPRRKGYSKN